MGNNTWYVNTDCRYFGTKEFIRFMKTAEYRVLMFLVAKAVRRLCESKNYYHNQIYKEYYEKGMVCTRYDQNTLAEIFEWVTKSGPNRRYIGRITRKLEKMKMLKIHKINGSRAYVYQTGYLDEEGNEILFYDRYFSLIVELEKEARNISKKVKYEQVKKEYEATMTDNFKEQIKLLHENLGTW
jgi:hypothetical protein